MKDEVVRVIFWVMLILICTCSCLTMFGVIVIDSRLMNIERVIVSCNKDTVSSIRAIYKTEKDLIEDVKIYENAFLKDIYDARKRQDTWVQKNKRTP